MAVEGGVVEGGVVEVVEDHGKSLCPQQLVLLVAEGGIDGEVAQQFTSLQDSLCHTIMQNKRPTLSHAISLPQLRVDDLLAPLLLL